MASGTGDRGFESRRFDQVKKDMPLRYIFFCFIEQGTRRGNGTERTSGGRPRPWKTERVVRARIESRRFDQVKKDMPLRQSLFFVRRLSFNIHKKERSNHQKWSLRSNFYFSLLFNFYVHTFATYFKENNLHFPSYIKFQYL